MTRKRQFNLEDALSGADVRTRSGKKVKVLSVDEEFEVFPLEVERMWRGEPVLFHYTKEGTVYPDVKDQEDLVIVEELNLREWFGCLADIVVAFGFIMATVFALILIIAGLILILALPFVLLYYIPVLITMIAAAVA